MLVKLDKYRPKPRKIQNVREGLHPNSQSLNKKNEYERKNVKNVFSIGKLSVKISINQR